MRLKIFLTAAEADCLHTSIPSTSPTNEVIGTAISLRQRQGMSSMGPDVLIQCDEVQGQEMLAYARSACHSAIDKFQAEFRPIRSTGRCR
jgi:hypothetical protein